MDKGYIVLEEKLVEAFFDFYEDKKSVDKDLKLKLFRFLKPFNITREQLEKYYSKISELPDAMKIQAMLNNEYWFVPKKEDFQVFSMENPFSDEIMQKLIEQSIYKVLLVSKNRLNPNFKEVNITSPNIQFPYIEKLYKNNKAGREKAQNHFKQFIKNAKEISIKDNYCEEYLEKIKSLFQDNPNCNITFYAEKTATDSIKKFFPSATIKVYDKNSMHDRYLCIDNKIEIILSSGFQYLFDDKKELTYIITEK